MFGYNCFHGIHIFFFKYRLYSKNVYMLCQYVWTIDHKVYMPWAQQ